MAHEEVGDEMYRTLETLSLTCVIGEVGKSTKFGKLSSCDESRSVAEVYPRIMIIFNCTNVQRV